MSFFGHERAFLKDILDRRERRFRVAGKQYGDLVSRGKLEVGYRCEEHAIKFPVGYDLIISAFILRDDADSVPSLDRADLLVEERTVLGDGELEHITLDQFRLRCVIRRDRILLPIRSKHELTVEGALNHGSVIGISTLAWSAGLSLSFELKEHRSCALDGSLRVRDHVAERLYLSCLVIRRCGYFVVFPC